MNYKNSLWLILLLALFLPIKVQAWQEQVALEFILKNNSLLNSYRNASSQFLPSEDTFSRLMEYTSAYGRAGVGGTDFKKEPFIPQVGVQLNIPLTSTKEDQLHALKAIEETRVLDEMKSKVLGGISELRRHEADLSASTQRLKFYKDKSIWLKERVKHGFDEVALLWDIGQKLNEERAISNRLIILVSSQRYQVAHFAGSNWQTLLFYLEGKIMQEALKKIT